MTILATCFLRFNGSQAYPFAETPVTAHFVGIIFSIVVTNVSLTTVFTIHVIIPPQSRISP